MARKLEFRNGEPEPVKCEECGKPHHPSLECVCNQ